jgi:hypothetical protein
MVLRYGYTSLCGERNRRGYNAGQQQVKVIINTDMACSAAK